MIYARINPDTSITLVDLDPAVVTAWVAIGNPKALTHLPLVTDAQPAPSATQYVVSAGYVVEATQVRQTWALANKTADQLEAEALQAEKQQIATYIADIQTQLNIDNAARALLTNVQRINELEKDTRATMKAVKFLLRQAKRAL